MTLKKIVALSVLLLSVASCVKAPEEEEIPTTPEAAFNAVAEAWGDADPLDMVPGDFIAQETSLSVESTSSVYQIFREGATISSLEKKSDRYKYQFIYQTSIVDNKGNESPQSSRSQTREIGFDPGAHGESVVTSLNQKLKPLASEPQLQFGFEKVLGLARSCYSPANLQEICRSMGYDSCEIKCRNLKVEEFKESAPAGIKAQDNCGGFADCKLRKKKVSFDWMVTFKKGEGSERQIVNYSATVSPDLPFLARLTQFCERKLFLVEDANNNKLLVQNCMNLNNYRPGPQ